MVASMTGFGRATAARDGREMTVELKSVNHRFLDIGYRMPRHLGYLEDVARKQLQQGLVRGHVDVYLSYRNSREDAREVILDEALIAAYAKSLSKLREFGLADDIGASLLAQLPDALRVTQIEDDRDAVTELFAECLGDAMEQLKAMRLAEGERIAADLQTKLVALGSVVSQVQERAPQIQEELLKRLRGRIEELIGKIADEARIIQEAAMQAERGAVDEELVRLTAHISAVNALLSGEEAAGKKLDFIAQEMNREMNTIGSKAGDLSLVQCVVEGKSLIEKIREQVQNIE